MATLETHRSTPPVRLLLLLTTALAWLAIATGCGDDDEGQSARYTPTFQSTPCWEEVVEPGLPSSCGFVTLPEDRQNPDGPQIEIAVAVIGARTPKGRPPLVFLDGGPSVSSIQRGVTQLPAFLRGDQELILFDQRGVGYSRPSLDCPEREEALWTTFETAGNSEAEIDIINAASVACIDRLRAKGINIEAFNTPAIAHDVADIVNALGFSEVDLYGFSYGTTVALEVMRNHPERIRSVVLDAASPPHRGITVDRVALSGDRALRVMNEACASSPTCTAIVGGTFLDLLEEIRIDLNEEPMQLEVPDAINDIDRPVEVDGNDIVAGVINALYETELLPVIPTLLASIRTRNETVIRDAADFGINGRTIFYEGMFLAVECHDRGRFWPAGAVRSFLRDRSDLASLHHFFAIPACEDIGIEFAPPEFNQPVSSPIPTLVLGGEYDPVTPPDWGADTAARLGNARFVELPGIGHGALGSHPCATQITQAFLSDSESPIDDGCIDDIPAPLG